jgi:hypothetical protein
MALKSVGARPTPRKVKASAQPGLPAILKPLKDRRKLDLVMDAVGSVELNETKAWNNLDILSTHTRIESIEAVPEGIFEVGKSGFTAVATVYVDLEYGDKDSAFSTRDSFPAEVQGHFDPDGKPVVDNVTVDTSSYYQ